jgi:gas vesicle protein
MNLKWFAIGLGVGAAVGAVVTVLSTPKTGTEMREMLKDRANDVRRYAVEEIKEDHYTIGDVINEINEGKEAVNREEKSVSSVLDAAADTFRSEAS